MGELRAYVVPVAALRDLLTGGGQRDRVGEIVRRALPTGPAPAPLGPVFSRVPGARVVPHDAPTPADLDRLLTGGMVPADRLPATWRLVEAVAADLATASTRVASERPSGLRPLGLALPEPADAAAGTWSADQARVAPGLRDLLKGCAPDLVVFWSARAGQGPTA